jgi:hypothetical protein
MGTYSNSLLLFLINTSYSCVVCDKYFGTINIYVLECSLNVMKHGDARERK